MINFLLKGILRDRSRSIFPMLTVAIGAFISVLSYAWIVGAFGEMINGTARFDTGHVKLVTKAYNEISDQIPNDLALDHISPLLQKLQESFPDVTFVPRIKFGGLLDIPDENDETRIQGPAFGFGIDLRSPDSPDLEFLNLKKGLTAGKLPSKPREILISAKYAKKLGVSIGDKASLIGSTADGSMAIYNFIISGLIEFGISAMDRGMIIADISDLQLALNMPDGASEILGFFPNMQYDDAKSTIIANSFNKAYVDSDNEFAPLMLRLRDQSGMDYMLTIMDSMGFIILFVFIGALSLVLWNAGLMGSLRRYGEIGVRLAIGESKGALYRSMILESILIGIIGSIIGTAIALIPCYYLQIVGFDISNLVKGSTSTIFPNIMRTKITPFAYWIGFIPGLFASVLGTCFAGIGVFKRQTAQLFKELEV